MEKFSKLKHSYAYCIHFLAGYFEEKTSAHRLVKFRVGGRMSGVVINLH